jgi:uncharacterized protein (TIRG00374 family)
MDFESPTQDQQQHSTVSKNRFPFRRLFVRLVGVGLFIVLILITDIDSVYQTLTSVSLPPLLIALAVALMVIFIRGVRWGFLLHKNGITCSKYQTHRVNYYSIFLSMVTPGRVGEFGKAFMLGANEPWVVANIVGTVLVDRLWDIVMISVLGLTSVMMLGIGFELNIKALALGVSACAIIFAGLAFALRTSLVAGLVDRLKNLIKMGEVQIIQTLRESLMLLVRTSPLAFILTLTSWILQIVMAHFLAVAIGLHITPVALVAFVAASTLLTLLPISFGGIGTRDGAFILIFAKMGYPPEAAISFSMCFLFTNVFLAMFGWLLWFIGRTDKDKEVRYHRS